MTSVSARIGTALCVLAALLVATAVTPVAAADDGAPLVDLNSATADQLMSLPGVGPAIAQRIIEYREKNGPFRKTVELINVQGIGEKTFDRIKDQITVGRSDAK